MNLQKFLPKNPFLRQFVESFILLETEEGMENRMIPGFSFILYFRYRGRMDRVDSTEKKPLPTAGITGLQNSHRLISYSAKTSNLLVTFKEAGATAFLRESLHEFYGKTIALRDVLTPSKIEQVQEQLYESKNDEERIETIEKFLIAELDEIEMDASILDSIRKIKATSGELRIRDLIAGLPMSTDLFEKKFRRIVGASPKRFSTIVRMKRFIQDYSPAKSFTEQAQTFGYFDQSHFTKDFKTFTGLNPKEYFKTPRQW
ncbi:helix-turn-helix domain-containing protein [Leptospira barantonii]|uniref:HTH araC/xylS-type domain-containing protein n=1 Tax=Leptospira barantonii TaxID=2023184 RepID=A0ABX4NM76_9LEPT|nr:helix-turn-helix domain-containing protein [Leptospira barantonii]PJZ57926.1 hypothetical protein CH367_05905 [Leptospira barantonii]